MDSQFRCEQEIANIFNLGLYGVVFVCTCVRVCVVICLLLLFLVGENEERTAKKLILISP